ncbi:MAG: T9SS type A sorting domain-containing protein [Bacteroidota bacterium]
MKQLVPFLSFLFLATVAIAQDWEEKFKLEASDQQSDDNHAISVSLSGDYLITGAWHEDHDASGGNQLSNAGAAYIYRYDSGTDSWSQEAKLVAADREAGDAFGISVGISGTYAVVGAVEENAARGAAYVFERNGSGDWVQVAKLEAPVRQASDRFGNSVGIYGSTIIVGAYHEDEDANDDDTLQNAGSSYIYTRGGSGSWGFSQKIVASDRDTNDYFGYSVAIWDDHLIVGAYHRDTPTLSEYGGAYAFEFNGVEWEQIRIMEAVDTYLGDRFGWSVDVYENYFMVGAPYHDYDDDEADPKNNAGAAYIFDASNSWAMDKIVGGDRTAQDNAGQDVAINGDRAVLGTPLQNYGINGDPPFWSDGGAVFVYEPDGSGFWNQTQKLLTEDRFTSDKFGHSVDLDSERIVGGAPEDNSTTGPSTGAAYIFVDGTLSNEDKTAIPLVAYPNPTSGHFEVQLPRTALNAQVTIYNMLGQKIATHSFENSRSISIEIVGGSGIYMVDVTTSEGISETIQIIKK